MKRAIQINLAGIIFHIDEDAYDILRGYLTGMEAKYSRTSGGPEIIQDMEHRMAELFTERLASHRNVITAEDVREVLKIMGAPEGFENRQSRDEGWRSAEGRFEGRRYRRMYRDPVDKPIGGVCSGLGYYLNMDPLIIRILFVVGLFVGFGLLAYIILWIAIPVAETPEQIAEMKHGSYNY